MTTHTIALARHTAQVVGLAGVLVLGTWDSYGTEQLLLRPGPEWDGLAIDATFHNLPNDKGVTVLADTDGLVPVPPEACMQPSRYATITFRGVQDGVQRISCSLPYMVLDHAQVPGANSTATPSENAQALAQMQDLRDGAVDAKRHAEAARDAAANSATAVAASEKAAASSAVAAAGSAAQAEAQKTAAAKSASDAQGYMQTASSAATAANASAKNAEGSKAAAASSATAAAASEKAAASSAVAAAGSAAQAEAQKTAAAKSASDAQGYMQTASSAATAANASAKNAEGSKAAAASSATAAAASATAAAGDAKTASDAAAGAADAKAAAVAAQKDAAVSKAAAANSAAAAKASEDAAAKSAADADSTANSINNSMMQIAANKEAVSRLKEDTAALQKRQNVLVGSETGNPVSCDDAFAAPLCGLYVYGKSTQDGTPSPDNPVPIVSAGDGGSVVVKVTGKNRMPPNLKRGTVVECFVKENTPITLVFKGDFVSQGGNLLFIGENNEKLWFGIDNNKAEHHITLKANATKFQYLLNDMASENVCLTRNASSPDYEPYREQLLTLPTPNGFPGIPVASGGNYTDPQGQQWVCDEVDLERGIKVLRIDKGAFDATKALAEQSVIRDTPIETPLTPAEIAAYKALTAYAPDTVVQASDGAGVKLEYQRDVNSAIKKLEDAIASMTAT